MTIDIRTHAKDQGKSIQPYWNFCVGAGRANEGLRAGWLEQLVQAREHCGFSYCRFHGLYHDDMFVYREDAGQPVYNFQYIDELFDRMLEIGVRPFVELGFCPADLASNETTVFWWASHVSPPNNYARWAELVTRSVEHWRDRYGLEEIKQWYYEVWNEPNLPPFFSGTKSQYLELYKVTAAAVKSVDPDLRIGGPATSNFVPDARFAGETEDMSQHAVVLEASDLDALDWQPVWWEDFLKYCESERLPVDFLSSHPYPTDWALDAHGQTVKSTRGVGATPRDLRLLREMVDSSPYPDAEIHLTEWSSSPSARDFTHDYPQAATYVVKANLESIGQVDSMAYWAFTDVFEENGAGDHAFHGGFGLMNFRGIPKPTFHAYRLLNSLGDELLQQTDGAVVTRDSGTGRLSALLYHYPPEVSLSVPASFDTNRVAEATLATGNAVDYSLELDGMSPGAAVLIETLDADHGNAPGAWRGMGSPHSPTVAQIAELKQIAWATGRRIVRIDEAGRLDLPLKLQPWAVISVREIDPE